MAARGKGGGKRARSAISGRWVTLRYAQTHPSTTIISTKKKK